MATNITKQKRQKLWQQTLLNKNDRNYGFSNVCCHVAIQVVICIATDYLICILKLQCFDQFGQIHAEKYKR
jgi:nitrite reductase/ring-hydroxylating ferredoxin subunit